MGTLLQSNVSVTKELDQTGIYSVSLLRNRPAAGSWRPWPAGRLRPAAGLGWVGPGLLLPRLARPAQSWLHSLPLIILFFQDFELYPCFFHSVQVRIPQERLERQQK